MNTLHYAIILDFQRTRFMNECEELNEKQFDLINDMTNKAYSLITEADYKAILSENENISLYTDIKNAIDKIMNENNLSFTDKRCYSYFYDGVYDMLHRLF